MLIVGDAAIKQFSERYYFDLITVSSVDYGIQANPVPHVPNTLSSRLIYEDIIRFWLQWARLYISHVLRMENNPWRLLFLYENCPNTEDTQRKKESRWERTRHLGGEKMARM